MVSEVAYKPLEKIPPAFAGGNITPPKFFTNYYEWLSYYGVQIVKSQYVVNADATIYSVPKNQTLFITSVFINSKTDSAGAGADVSIMLNKNNFIGYTASDTDQAVNGFTLSFPIPIKVTSSDYLEVRSGAGNLQVWGGFTGFLVGNEDITQA